MAVITVMEKQKVLLYIFAFIYQDLNYNCVVITSYKLTNNFR